MAKPYLENGAWAYRLRVCGEDIYQGGFASESQARRHQEQMRAEVRKHQEQAGAGAFRTTLAQALLEYGLHKLPKLKGARQEAQRINTYLRAAGLPTIKVHSVQGQPHITDNSVAYCRVELIEPAQPRRIPLGLGTHRQAQAERTSSSLALRQRLALMPLAKIQPEHVQKLIDTLLEEGLGAGSITLEISVLRQLFSYADKTLQWVLPHGNPAKGRDLPKPADARDRVLSNQEWGLIEAAQDQLRNPWVAPALALLLQTSMRVGEALVQATWEDFDEERCLLHLRKAKAGARDVPLGPQAMEIMRQLREQAGPSPDPQARILPISYSAISQSWRRLCKRTGIKNAHLHDLRHTAATRFAVELGGNMPVLRIITGHKTDKMLLRYVNLKAEDVARLLHGHELALDAAAAGHCANSEAGAAAGVPLAAIEPAMPVAQAAAQQQASNVVQFIARAGGRRAI